MKAFAKQFILGSLLFIIMSAQAIGQTRVQAQVDRSRPIYAGSRFNYRIIIENGQQQGDIDLSSLKAFDPSGPSIQNSTSIVNGRASSSQALTYQLLAPAEGEHTIPPVQVTVDGKTYQTNPVSFSVVEPGSTKHIDIEMELSTQQSYVGQPIILTASFYIWAAIVQADQIQNIDIRIPLLNSGDFYLEDLDAQTVQAKQIVFPVNGRNEQSFQDQLDHDSVNCVRIRLFKVLIPKKTGTFQIEPAVISADLAVGRKQRSRNTLFDDFWGSQYEYKRFSAKSAPLELTVEALPSAGQPADFYGLVGNYQISATAAPTEVNVGDPITLQIKVSGSQYLKPVQWPDLEKISEMSTQFKIPADYADGKIEDGVKVFTQTLRANSDTVTHVPPIPLSFFDVNAGAYRTVQTEPIPLNVSPTRVITGSDVESRQVPASKKQVEAIREGLSANYTSLDALKNQHFSPFIAMTGPAFISLYILPMMGLIGSAVARYMITDSPKRQAANRRKKAYSHAVKRLKNASHHDKPSQQVLVALQQYIADKFGKSAGSLTAIDCQAVIMERTQDAELASLYHGIMEQTEASEYSPMAFKLTEEKQDEILGLLYRIEKKIK